MENDSRSSFKKMTITEDHIEELKFLIEESLDILYSNDQYIIDNSTNERAVVFKFGTYMYEIIRNSSFYDFDLDSEYNRRHAFTKRTKNFPDGIIPDLLIHERNSQDNNLLVMEFKGYWNKKDRSDDFIKLQEFTCQDKGREYYYGYALGVFVFLTPNRADVETIYFKNGVII